jgi:hypothetical protein
LPPCPPAPLKGDICRDIKHNLYCNSTLCTMEKYNNLF